MEVENDRRRQESAMELRPVEIRILGQVTLLANDIVAKVLTLQRTNDLDATFNINQDFVTDLLRNKILPQHGLVLDSDSELVWIPPKSQFEDFCAFKNVSVKLLDPESALVSKAVKAKQKNRVLVVDAIASDQFPNLVQRIKENNGDLEYFLGGG